MTRLFRLRIYRYLLVLLLFSEPFLLGACHSSTQLNSERIAERYGNYGIEILQSGNDRRLSSLYSVSEGIKTMRTLALVNFSAANDSNIVHEHERVLAGESIGAVFKDSGWTIDKVSSHYCQTQLDIDAMPELLRMEIVLPATLATRRYIFRIRKGAVIIDYANITEIYHPDYLQAADLTSANLADC